jgi:thiamine monophosphate synthase
LLKKIREKTDRPLVAIGGIHSTHFKDLVACGVDGIALISEIYREGFVYDRISQLVEALRNLAVR